MAGQSAHGTVAVVDEARGGHAVDAVTALFVRGRGPQDQRPGRPGVVVEPCVRRAGQDLELVHQRRPLTVRGAQAVRTRVATADDHHALAVAR